jgi:hypothetical protein
MALVGADGVGPPRYDHIVRGALAVSPGVRSLVTGLRHRPAVWVVAAAGVTTAVTFPVVVGPAESGLDPSWRIGLELAAARHLDFGTEIVYTYGPLGFLILPHLVVTWVSVLAFVYTVASGFLLAATLVYSALKSFHPLIAIPLAYVLAWAPIDRGSVLAICLLVWSVHTLQGTIRPELISWLAPIGATIAGFEMLIKVHVGAMSLGIVLVTTLLTSPSRLRDVATASAAAAVTVVVLFAVTGNPVTSLPDWIKSAREVTGGYSASAAVEQPGLEWHYLAAAALPMTIGLLMWRQTAVLGRLRQAAAVSFFATFAFAAFKLGFVRHAGDHPQYFFASVAIAALAARWRGRARWGVLATSLIALVLAFDLSQTTELEPRLKAAASQARTLVTTSRRAELIQAGKQSIRDQLQVEPQVLRHLVGRTVHVAPYETSAVWGYELRWRPVPAFQHYIAAFSGALDQRNADFLTSSRAPERILRMRGTEGLDHTFARFEAPETLLTTMCRYREVAASERWQALARDTARCGPSRLIATEPLRNGQLIPVPAAPHADDLVYARLTLAPSIGSRLRDLFYKPTHLPAVTLDETMTYRYTAATAADAHVLRVPQSLGYSLLFDGALQTNTLRFDNLDNPSRIDFYATPVAPHAKESN